MEILKKIPLELQRIVVSYSRPEYPYLMEYKISKIYSHEKLFTLQKDFLNDNKMSSVIEKELRKRTLYIMDGIPGDIDLLKFF